jgi:hypothetical protein
MSINEAGDLTMQERPYVRDTEPHRTDPGLHEVREILFGESQRETARQLAEISQRLSQEVEGLQQALRDQREQMEAAARAESAILLDKLHTAMNDQSETTHGLTRDLQALRNTVQESLVRLEEKLTSAQHRQRQDLQQEMGQIRALLNTQVEQLSQRIEDEVVRLRREERQTLSGLFSHLSQHLAVTPNSGSSPTES